MATESKIIDGIKEYKLDSWKEFHGLIADAFADTPAYIFRGQPDAQWKVRSSLDRLERRFPTHRNVVGKVPPEFPCPPVTRETHLRAFRQAMRGRRGRNPQPLNEDETWALAQHHGLATPMLDWTLSPFVALYFAFEEKEVQSEDGSLGEPEHRAVFAVSTTFILANTNALEPPPTVFMPKLESNQRLLAQSGLFLRLALGCDLESYVRSHFESWSATPTRHGDAVLRKIIIKNDDRIGCLKMLNKMNINRLTLYPDLDGACQYINALWEIDFDTSLGHLGEDDPQ